MHRVQNFVLRSVNQAKQRLLHPQNEALEQLATHSAPATSAAQTTIIKVAPLFSLQLATQAALNTIRRSNQMKQLIFQLRRPFRSGHFINTQRRAVMNLTNNRAATFENYNSDISVEDMDDFWHLQNQHVNRQQQDEEDDESSQTDSLSQSSLSQPMNLNAQAAFEGAYEGILSILDDPRKRGARHYCRHRIETKGDFVHREDLQRKVQDIDAVSEHDSVMRRSYVDSVQEMAIDGTREFLSDLRAAGAAANNDYDSYSEASSNLARSLDHFELEEEDSSYELLSSKSGNETPRLGILI